MMNIGMFIWMGLLDEGIPLLLLIALGLALYRGFKKNYILLMDREDLLRRYLIFRVNKQMHLKTFEDNPKTYQELLKALSNSWKIFKKRYDDYIVSLNQNTTRTKLTILIITLGLLMNSLRMIAGDFYLIHSKPYLLLAVLRELSGYVLVILSFLLMRAQTHRILVSRGKIAEMDRETLFFSNNPSEEEVKSLFDEFDPIEEKGVEDGQKDQDHHGGA